MWNIWNTRWIRCKGSCLQLLGFWNFFIFFRFFPVKLLYFLTKNRIYIYGCFFHSFCVTDLNFGMKNNPLDFCSTLERFEPHIKQQTVTFFFKNIYECPFTFRHSIPQPSLPIPLGNNRRTFYWAHFLSPRSWLGY